MTGAGAASSGRVGFFPTHERALVRDAAAEESLAQPNDFGVREMQGEITKIE